jgi:CheY-like chemotaxis protein
MSKKVLLVDDMGGIRRSVAHLLRQSGFEVIEAENGRAALDLLKQHEFVLVLTDILMPEVDGGAVINWLTEQPGRPKVIAMSGGGAQSTADQALREARDKADAILMKPFARDDLMKLVQRYAA